MLNTAAIGAELRKHGFDFYSGVPCSFLKDLINYAINDVEYYGAANEGDAVAIATGATLAGRKSVVLMQNSGLTNATSPLTSLNYIFRTPVLGFVTLRGEEGVSDEPQHELMGKITIDFLTSMQVAWEFLSTDLSEASQQIARASQSIENKKTFFFVVKKGTFDSVALKPQAFRPTQAKVVAQKSSTREDQRPSRIDALSALVELKTKDTLYFATTGFTGRELYELADLPNNFYMVGSMGCISSLGMGFALALPNKEAVVIDGDGSLLMRMGALATQGNYRPKNMLHILLDNNSHDSTGGQATVSQNVDFVSAASACGYPRSVYAHDLNELSEFVKSWRADRQLTFIHLRIRGGAKDGLGRPKVKPFEVAARFMEFARA